MKVVWFPKAVKSYTQIADFILNKWTKKELKKFIEITSSTIVQITKNPEMFVASQQRKNIRKGFITKHTSLYYRIKHNKIELI